CRRLVPWVDQDPVGLLSPHVLHLADVQIRQRRMKGIDRGLDVLAVGALLGVANSVNPRRATPANSRAVIMSVANRFIAFLLLAGISQWRNSRPLPDQGRELGQRFHHAIRAPG